MAGPKFGTIKSYYKNQIIFKEGHPGNVGYLVKTGEVTIYKIIDNEKKILSKLGPGEIFGEMGLVTESHRTAFAEASEYCDLVVIDKETLHSLLKQSPKMIQSITIFLMKRLAGTLEMLVHHDDTDKDASKKMLSICSLLDLMSRSSTEINYQSFCTRAMDIAGILPKEIDSLIHQLIGLKVIEVKGEYQKAKTSDCTITVFDGKALLASVKKKREKPSYCP